MNMLATEFHPVGTELPAVAFIRIALAPIISMLGLVLCVLVYGEPFTSRYAVLAMVAFFLSARIFGELPLAANGRSKLAFVVPNHTIITDWVTVVGILLFLAFLTKVSAFYSRKVVLTWFAVTPFLLNGAQKVAWRLLTRAVSSGTAVRSKVIVGVNQAGYELARKIGEDPCLGVIKGFFDDRTNGRLEGVRSRQILGGLDDVADYVKRNSINVVYITLPMSQDPRIMRLLGDLRDTTASVYFVPNTLPFDLIQGRVDHIGEVAVIAVCETPFYGINGVVKRATDIIISSLILSLIWPLMLGIAIAIRRGSPGPVLFKQRRYGLDGKEILVYKFRTMTVCEDGDRIEQAKKNDQRITRFGAFLRRTSLDELPQFFNVLEGTMSIVGPRPHAVAHNEQYRKLIRGYMIRHKVKPGITGWAQVNGFRGETETVDKMKKRIEYDLDYLKHWSASLDFRIVFRTLFVVWKDSNAY